MHIMYNVFRERVMKTPGTTVDKKMPLGLRLLTAGGPEEAKCAREAIGIHREAFGLV